MNLNIETAIAGLKIIAETDLIGAARKCGVDEDVLKRFVGGSAWLAGDRHKYTEILKLLSFASLDLQGLPRFPLPAEYITCVIFSMVAKNNWMVACRFIGDYACASSLADLSDTKQTADQMEKARPEKIFGLLNLMLANQNSCDIARSFARKISIPIEWKKEIRKEQN